MNKRILLSPEIVRVDKFTVIVTGIEQFEGVIESAEGKNFILKGRQSFVFNKERNDWRIIHHHRSKTLN